MNKQSKHTADVKFTPGPWHCNPTAGYEIHGQYAVYSDTGSTLAVVYDGEKDARLIAAAPELLEACQRAICDLELAHGGRDTLTLRQLRAALAKATGN